MRVSVVIPVRNAVRFVAEAVASALAQSEVAEVVVVDDGSSDGSAGVARALGSARVVVLDGPGRGVSAARNRGLAALATHGAAASEWVVFLDADDRLRPGAVAALAGAASADCVAVYGDYDRIDENGAPIGRRGALRHRRKPSGDILARLLAGSFLVNGGIMLIRRSAFAAIGGFDETLAYCEDWHAFCRLAACGPILFRQATKVLDYRVHASSAMMDSRCDFALYRPAIEAVFADPLIAAKVGASERARLRRDAETHLRTYLASQTLRARAYWRAAPLTARAIGAHPARAPRILARLVAAAVGL